MIFVRLIEDRPGGTIIYDTKMACCPRVGETFTLRFPDRQENQYRVVAVDYLLDVSLEDGSIKEDLTGVRVVVTKAGKAFVYA